MSLDLGLAPETCPDCGARSGHFRCQGCGAHQLHDHIPCWKCKWWKFGAVDVTGALVIDVSKTLPAEIAEVSTTINIPPTKTKKQRGPKPPT